MEAELNTIITDYSPDDIFNADETGMFYRMMPDKTLEFKSVDCNGGKQSKERLTVMVCANMSGNEKLPLFVIGKAMKPRCFKNVKSLPTEYTANKRAWMTSEIFRNWLRKIDEQMKKNKRRIVMVVDNCPAHPKMEGLLATTLVFLPPNTTSLTQPCDEGIIQNLKVHYRKHVIQRRLRAIDSKTDETPLNVLDGLRFLHRAWNAVSATTIANCYRHAGFTRTQTPTADDADDEDDDDVPLAMLISRASLGVSLQDYAAADNHVPTSAGLTDEQILEEVLSSRQLPTDADSDDDDETPQKPRPSVDQAMMACEVLRTFMEAQENSGQVLPAMAKLDSFVSKVHLSRLHSKQTDITKFFRKDRTRPHQTDSNQ